MDRHKFLTVDEFIDTFSGETRKRLELLRTTIKRIMPEAVEKISYNIPAYFLNGKMVLYFAGYEHHVSLYPGQTLNEAHNKLAAKYASGKSTLKFPNAEPLPMELIESFIRLRIEESAS